MVARLLTVLTVVFAARAGAQSAVAPSPDKLRRLEQDRAGLLESLERARETATSAELLGALESLLAEDSSPGWLQLDGWALRRKDVESYVAWFKPDPERGPAVLDVAAPGHPIHRIRYYAETLEKHGIDLLVVPIPMRVQVYPDRVPGVRVEEPFHGVAAEHTQLLLALSAAGIEVADLLPAFAQARDVDEKETDRRLFMDYDHHWTPRGVALAADRIAERVRSFSWYEQGNDREGVDFRVEVTAGSPRPLHIPQDGPRRPQEEVWFRAVRPVGDASKETDAPGARAVPKEDESGLTPGSILLIGDSFVGEYTKESSDLARHLYARLGHSVDMIYNPGGGMRVWKTVARRGDRLLEKKLIIWAFFSRALSDPPSRRTTILDER